MPFPLLNFCPCGLEASPLLNSVRDSTMAIADARSIGLRHCTSILAHDWRPSIKVKRDSFSVISGISRSSSGNSRTYSRMEPRCDKRHNLALASCSEFSG
ncbi:hypothetical protein U1Q18_052786 [Sarracenia purpurea var. burkii]